MKLIAEWGQSHLGNLDRAKEQVLATKRAGWHYAKWQMFDPARLAGPTAVRYWDSALGGSQSQRATFQDNGDLAHHEWWELAAFCETQGIEFLCTPFDLEAVDLLEEMGVSAYKIASADLTYTRLLRKVAKTGKHVFLSTGAAREDEIKLATREFWNGHLTLLACTLSYPTQPDEAHVARIGTLRRAFPGVQVGYSDHVISHYSGLAAAAVGAVVLEKHCTIYSAVKDSVCPDDQMALSSDHMSFYGAMARIGETMRGSGALMPLPSEEAARAQARRSAHTTRNLRAGHVLKAEDIIFKRPAAGGFSDELKLVGKKLCTPVKAGVQLTEEHL